MDGKLVGYKMAQNIANSSLLGCKPDIKWYLQESVLCLFLFDIVINDTGDKTEIKLDELAEDVRLQRSKTSK